MKPSPWQAILFASLAMLTSTKPEHAARSTRLFYSDVGQVTAKLDGEGYLTEFRYDAAGNLDTVTYPNGHVTDYDYNSINQLTDVYTRDGKARWSATTPIDWITPVDAPSSPSWMVAPPPTATTSCTD